MSAWKLFVNEIKSRATQSVSGSTADARGIQQARVLGLIERNESGRWKLTNLGQDWCDGKIIQVEGRPGGRRWVATWLRALPDGIRIGKTPANPHCACKVVQT